MRKAWKRTMALALAVVMLLSLSVFGVSADVESSSDKVVYDFYQPQYIDADCNAKKEQKLVPLYHYDSDTGNFHSVLGDIYDRYGVDLNWRYEAANSVYQFRFGEYSDTDAFNNGTHGNNLMGHEYAGIQYCTGANGWFAVRIKSPGSGVYSVSLKHGTHENGALEGNIYILDAAGIDAAVAAATIEGVTNIPEAQSDDPYQNNEGKINAVYTSYISSNLTDVIATSNWCSEEAGVVGSAVSTAGVYNFEAGKEYVLVLKATKDTNVPKKDGTDNTNAYLFFGELIAEKVTDLPVVPTDKSIVFYTDAYKAYNAKKTDGVTDAGYAPLGAIAAAVKADYEAENSTQDWRIESGSQPYQFRSTTSYGGTYMNISYTNPKQTMRCAWIGGSIFALRIKSPGTGNFAVSLTYATATSKATEDVDMYLVPASVIEKAVTDAGRVYSDDAAAIPAGLKAGESNDAIKAVNAAITSAITDTAAAYSTPVIEEINFSSTTSTKDLSKPGSTVNMTDGDYIAVFKNNDTSASVYAMYLQALNFAQVVETSNVASNGTTSYTTIAEALEKTTSGTVTVTANSVEEELAIPDGVTLDLNGKTVYADAVTTADAAGNAIIDNGATKGKLITSSVAFDEANSGYVPVADGNTYVFYKATVARYNPYFANGDTSAAKFYFDVELDDAAYAVLAEDISQLSVSVGLSWVAGGAEDSIEPVGYAESVNQGWVDGEVGGGNYAWYLNVTGLSVLAAGDTVTVAPTVTVNGVAVTVTPVTYTVE